MSRSSKERLGLIVNPIAGIGGRVGLRGSDGIQTQRRALELGAVRESSNKAGRALERLGPLRGCVEIITFSGEMGEEAVVRSNLKPTVIGSIVPGRTTARDTREAARAMLELGVALLLFAGGDGTARDICQAVGEKVPALGIPAGVKIHSAVFGANPQRAGGLALSFLRGEVTTLRACEVMDIDEVSLRRGVLSSRLYGYLKVPHHARRLQGLKTPSVPGEAASLRAIADKIVADMKDDCLYIVGPGTTTRAITSRLGLDKTLVGVDVVCNGRLIATDANESILLQLLKDHEAKIIVTPIGGQGFLFGRGNQQISPQVIRAVGRENIVVVSTPGKLHSFGGRPLKVDSGDPTLDEMLAGYVRVITGHHEQSVCRVD